MCMYTLFSFKISPVYSVDITVLSFTRSVLLRRKLKLQNKMDLVLVICCSNTCIMSNHVEWFFFLFLIYFLELISKYSRFLRCESRSLRQQLASRPVASPAS